MTVSIPIRKWFLLGILSLAFVALYGALMRYKIAFSLPFLDQKNILHAHSHFAFTGWVSHILYSGLALLMAPFITTKRANVYKGIIYFNLIASFGMLIAFTFKGYHVSSMMFSGLCIVASLMYTITFIADARKIREKRPAHIWAIIGLIFNVLSALGPMVIGYIIATKNMDSRLYLGSVYYHLHFQYSGWFFFAGLAIIINMLPQQLASLNKHFTVLAAVVIPTFILSILWAKPPLWLYVITVIAALVQLTTWILILVKGIPLLQKEKNMLYPKWVNVFFYASALAVTIKFLLQAISVVPSLSHLVFGIRPIVIAYLHLVLLGVYTLFIIGYAFSKGFIVPTSFAKKASFGFLVGVILNELFLGIQGIAAFTYTPIPYINQLLLVAALTLFISALLLLISQFCTTKN
ncbi:MAG: hypothetical protein KF781_01460 [Chitinophagaceae bacterium]|nr:hypothetical protein [Chitinophagaceae bacterium]MCW5905402.1 hypothetical protein [Chitinophagaceae bacterium]